MEILLDTCTFLWIVAGAPELSEPARALFADPGNVVHLSTVSAWEIMVKNALGRLPLPVAAEHFIPQQRKLRSVESMPLTEDAVLQLSRLPPLHKDPFDRMLVCQAIASGMPILTPDPAIQAYPVRTLW